MEWIKCDCGVKFWGMEGKEDTCRHCLRKLLGKKEINDYSIEDIEMLEYENKYMSKALLKLGYTDEQISDVCNGAI